MARFSKWLKKPKAVKLEKSEHTAQPALQKKHFQQALKDLRKVSGGKRYINQLPWYAVMGMPQAGKSAILAHSELLGSQLYPQTPEHLRSISDCDWWLADEAILLDTPSDYMGQDKVGETSPPAWICFLNLLRKHRPRRPLNGVIVVVSALDLMQEYTAHCSTQAALIRQRLNELHERLGIHPPIYLLVTQCDLLAGFTEFFNDLDSHERAQVWGMTFPLTDKADIQPPLDAFSAEFNALQQQLQARVLQRMRRETDHRQRALVYNFPQQFAGLQSTLQQFIGDTFSVSRFKDPCLLRGVYFASAMQQGQPIYRVMSTVAATLDPAPPSRTSSEADGQAYFLYQLWREVIFREAELVNYNRKLENRRKWLQRSVIFALIGVLFVASAALLTSYHRNSALVADVSKRVTKLQENIQNVSGHSDLLTFLPLLNEAHNLADADGQQNQHVPFLSRLGLYQGDTLRHYLSLAYQQLLREELLPLIVHTLEDELRRGDANSPDNQYQILRAYLMLGNPSHFDADVVRMTVSAEWRENILYNASEKQRAEIDIHLAELLKSMQFDMPLPLNAALIDQARITLANLPLAQRIFNNIKRQLEQAKLPSFSLSNVAGRRASLASSRRSGASLCDCVSGAYTQKGYAQFLNLFNQDMIEIEKANWVLGQEQAEISADNIEALKATLPQLYYDEYIKQWDNFLQDINLLPFEKLGQGASIANLLSAADSPLRLLMAAVAQETTLANVAAAKTPVDAMTNPVDAHFQSLHDVVKKPEGTEQAPLEQVLSALKEVAMFFDAAEAARSYGLPIPPSNALNQLKFAIQGTPAPLANILDGVVTNGTALLKDGERARLSALWIANIAPFCKQALEGRYPFIKSSKHETTQEDFAKIFGPGRLIDDFFQTNLKAYVDMSTSKWRWRGNNTLGISDDVLIQFQRAAQIRDAFFQDEGRKASIRFNLKLASIDSTLARFKLDLDGQSLAATHGVAEAVQFQWPGGKAAGLIHMEFLPAPATGQKEVTIDGSWALLRLLDMARLEPTQQADRFKLTFDSAGRKVVFELNASSVINPFKRTMLEQFRCPVHL